MAMEQSTRKPPSPSPIFQDSNATTISTNARGRSPLSPTSTTGAQVSMEWAAGTDGRVSSPPVIGFTLRDTLEGGMVTRSEDINNHPDIHASTATAKAGTRSRGQQQQEENEVEDEEESGLSMEEQNANDLLHVSQLLMRTTVLDPSLRGLPCPLLRAMRSNKELFDVLSLIQTTMATTPQQHHTPSRTIVSSSSSKVSMSAREIKQWLLPHDHRMVLVEELKAVLKSPLFTFRRQLPAPIRLLAAIRRARGRSITRSKDFYHRWFAVVRYELLWHYWRRHRGESSAVRRGEEKEEGSNGEEGGGPLIACWAGAELYGFVLHNHSLGPERLSGSKAFLYKATVHQLRETEARLQAFKRDFMALRKTRTCKARNHSTDAMCAGCNLIRRGDKEMFRTCLQTGAEAMYPVAFLHDFFRSQMERLRDTAAKVGLKLKKYEAALFPVGASAIKHFMSKHLARQWAKRNEAKVVLSLDRYHARRILLMQSLIVREKPNIRTVYKRFSELSREVEVFVVEEVVRRKKQRMQAAAAIQRVYRAYRKRLFMRKQAAEEEMRRKRRKRIHADVERKKAAMQQLYQDVMGRYKHIRKQKGWTCPEVGCEKKVWNDPEAFDVHRLVHYRHRMRRCFEQTASVARDRRMKRICDREIKVVQAVVQVRREREEAERREQDLIEEGRRSAQKSRGRAGMADYPLALLPAMPRAELAMALAQCWQRQQQQQQPDEGGHNQVASLSDQIIDFARDMLPSAETCSQLLSEQHQRRVQGPPPRPPRPLVPPFHRLYPTNSTTALQQEQQEDQDAHSRQQQQQGGEHTRRRKHQHLGHDRRTCPHLSLVSVMAHVTVPDVIELRRKKTVIIGSGRKATVRVLAEEGAVARWTRPCAIDREHLIVHSTWTGSRWEVSVKDNHTSSGSYLLNANGLTRVTALGQTRVHDHDLLLLGQSCLPDDSVSYDVILQLHVPLVPRDPLPSSLRPIHLINSYEDIRNNRDLRTMQIRQDII